MNKIANLLINYNTIYNGKRLLISHLIYLILSCINIFLLSQCNKKKINNINVIGLTISFILILILLIFGKKINGAKRWLRFGISIQPSSLLLCFYPYCNGSILSKGNNKKSVFMFFLFLFTIIIQPDFGSALILSCIWIVQSFFFGELFKLWKVILATISIFAVTLLTKGSYALQRISKLFAGGDEMNQTFLALKIISLSKFFPQKQNFYLAEMHNDYFFSALLYNGGLILGFFYIVLWITLLNIMINILKKIPSQKSQGIMLGMITLIGAQSFLHIFTNLHLIPPKGTSLPFLSTGGSFMFCNACVVGMLLSFL